MKYTKALVKIGPFIVALLLTLTVTAQNAEKSKLSFKEGQKFQTDNTVKTTTSMEMMGQQMDITANVTAARLFEIKAKKENNYTAALTITKMAMNADMMGQALSYDSEKPEDRDGEMGKAFKDKLNVPVEMEIDADGKITTNKKDADKKEADSKEKEEGINAMMKSFGAGADESAMADDMFILLPKKVKAGDTWSDSVVVDGMKTYRDYTVKSVQGNEATITITGKQLIDKKMENQGMEMTLVMENKLTGEALVDTGSNIAKQKTLTAEGSGNMEMMGQQVPMTTKVETTSATKSL